MLFLRTLPSIALTTIVVLSMAKSETLKEVEFQVKKGFQFDLNHSKDSVRPGIQVAGAKERHLLEVFLDYLHSNIPHFHRNKNPVRSNRNLQEVWELEHGAGISSGSTGRVRNPNSHRKNNPLEFSPNRKVLEFENRAGFSDGSTGNVRIPNFHRRQSPSGYFYDQKTDSEYGHRAGFSAGSASSLHHLSGKEARSSRSEIEEAKFLRANATKLTEPRIRAMGTSGLVRKEDFTARKDRLESSKTTLVEQNQAYGGIGQAETNENVQKYRGYRRNVLADSRHLDSEHAATSLERNVFKKSSSADSKYNMNMKTPPGQSDSMDIANKLKMKSTKGMEFDGFKSNDYTQWKTANGMHKQAEEDKYDKSQISVEGKKKSKSHVWVDSEGGGNVEGGGYADERKVSDTLESSKKMQVGERSEHDDIDSENGNNANEDLGSNIGEKSDSSRKSEYDIEMEHFKDDKEDTAATQSNLKLTGKQKTIQTRLKNSEHTRSQKPMVSDEIFESKLSSNKKSKVSDYGEVRSTNDFESRNVADLEDLNPNKSKETENANLNDIKTDNHLDRQLLESEMKRRTKHDESEKLGFRNVNAINKTFESSFNKSADYGSNESDNLKENNSIENETEERNQIKDSKIGMDDKASKFRKLHNKIKKLYSKIPEDKRNGKFSTFEGIEGAKLEEPNVVDKTYESNFFKKSKKSEHSEKRQFSNVDDVQSSSVSENSSEKTPDMNEGSETNEDNLDLTTLDSNKIDYENASKSNINFKTIDSNKLKNLDKDGGSDESEQSEEGTLSPNVNTSDKDYFNFQNRSELNNDANMSELNASDNARADEKGPGNVFKSEHDTEGISAEEIKGEGAEDSSKSEDDEKKIEPEAAENSDDIKSSVINNNFENGKDSKLHLEDSLDIKKLESRKSNDFNFRNQSGLSELTDNEKNGVDHISSNSHTKDTMDTEQLSEMLRKSKLNGDAFENAQSLKGKKSVSSEFEENYGNGSSNQNGKERDSKESPKHDKGGDLREEDLMENIEKRRLNGEEVKNETLKGSSNADEDLQVDKNESTDLMKSVHERRNTRRWRKLKNRKNNLEYTSKNRNMQTKQKMHEVSSLKQKKDVQKNNSASTENDDVTGLKKQRSKFPPRKSILWGNYNEFMKNYGSHIQTSQKQTTELTRGASPNSQVRKTGEGDRQTDASTGRQSSSYSPAVGGIEWRDPGRSGRNGRGPNRGPGRRCGKAPPRVGATGETKMARKHSQQERKKSCKNISEQYNCIFCSKTTAAWNEFLRCFELLPKRIRNIFGPRVEDADRSALCRKKPKLLKVFKRMGKRNISGTCLSSVCRKYC